MTEKATERPWRADGLGHIWRTYRREDGKRAHQPVADVVGVIGHEEEWLANAELIVKAVNNYDQLASIARGLSTCITQGAQLETPDMLDWIADRLVKVHGEDPNVDYVMTLRVRANNMRAALSRYTAFMEGEE